MPALIVFGGEPALAGAVPGSPASTTSPAASWGPGPPLSYPSLAGGDGLGGRSRPASWHNTFR